MKGCFTLFSFFRSAFNVLTVTILFSSLVSARASTNMQAECVGRMQLNLPKDAEVAASSFPSLNELITTGSGQRMFRFADNEVAGFSSLRYNGEVYVSGALSPAEIEELKSNFLKHEDYIKKLEGKKSIVETLSDKGNVTAFRYGSSIRGLIRIKNHLFMTTVDLEENDFSLSKTTFDTLEKNLTYRPIFATPRVNGICLPNSFIADSGNEHRTISMTYRLNSHPDVTVWLEDKNEIEDSERKIPRSAISAMKYWINDFWGQYEVNGKKITSKWSFPAGRAVKLDGREGLASFVQITRRDGSQDFGYLAVLRRDPEAKQDSPDLRFFVIREAERAKAKGIKPMDEKEFLALAQTIASTIRHRETALAPSDVGPER